MHLRFLTLPVAERQLYFEQVAARRSLHVAIVEKDFWVCWLLGAIFTDPNLRDVVVFKGGTSLSKVHRAITRFSEDIDLSVAPAWLGIAEDELAPEASRGQRDRWMTALQEACTRKVVEELQPRLEATISAALGPPQSRSSWLEYQSDTATNSPILLMNYPRVPSRGFDYLPRSVKLEFGSLTEQRPVGRHPVRPWLAEEIPAAFADWQCEVVALDVGRSFWEKATILHAEHHRPSNTELPLRYSRHYADVAALASSVSVQQALHDSQLRQHVVNWKARFFARSWARYDLAVPPTFRLLPAASRVAALAKDYAAMEPMFYAAPPPFAAVLATLRELEAAVNAG